MAEKIYSFLIQFIIFLNGYFAFGFDCASNDGKLQVHMVPHSHDDVGWLKTVDQYYYGSKRKIQDAAVQYIIDSVVMSLQQDPKRTFIYVEMAFFKRWWDEQNAKTKGIVRKLVKDKQLEFINGGWSMNDEAATHYNALIDQMTVGLRFINDTFGNDARPTVAWHIDPFGHSAEQASLFSLMSFDGFFLGRIDHADKDKRKKEKRMEMVWKGSRDYGKASEIFTGVLYNNYAPPKGFSYDEPCLNSPPIQDNPRLYDMNVKERVDSFVKATCEQAKHFKTNHIILTMGEDFKYQNAHRWYKNMDKLIRYVNEDGRVNAFYSSPSRYLKALHDSKKTWELKTDDFFPYSHRPHSYWTGYFTSRPALKGYIRESNKILQACKQIEVMRGNTAEKTSSDFLRRSMAVNQHHDAVTGTEKQHVANDYAKRLHMGRTDCEVMMNSFIKHKYVGDKKQPISLDFKRCDYLNISVCAITETQRSIVLNIYNPIGRRVHTYIRVPVNSKKFIVLDEDGNPDLSQVLPISKSTLKLRNNHKGYAAYELISPVSIPALGFVTVFLNRTSNMKLKEYAPFASKKKRLNKDDNFIENEFIRLEFSPDTGKLTRMYDKKNQLSQDVDQSFLWYEGSTGDKVSKQTSGAYIFRPRKNQAKPISKHGKVKTKIIKGPLLSEVHQIFNPFVSQVIRLYKGMMHAEFEHTIGPIPVSDHIGKEIITRFKTNIASKGIFYTDANGREMKKRKRDYRETWKLNSTDPISQNYYPINSRIFIKDSSTQLTIMTDRSQGGTSMRDGEVEIMLHRRLLKDDFLGVAEALNETGVSGKGLVTRGKHLVFLATPEESSMLHRRQGEFTMMEPIIAFSKNPYSIEEWRKRFHPVYSALTRPLPANVHLLTLETTRRKEEIILRLEHFFEKDESPTLSKPVTVNLESLFTDFNVIAIIELNLSANQYLKDKKMWSWNTTASFNVDKPSEYNKSIKYDTLEITLQPMEMRTFLLRIKF